MSDSPSDDAPLLPMRGAVSARHFGHKTPQVHSRFGALSHPGLVRARNEDHYLVVERYRGGLVLMTNLPDAYLPSADDTAYLLAVADGIGGEAFGELAGMLALRGGWEQVASSIKWPWVITDSEIESLKERLCLVFRRMHEELPERARQESVYAGMGAALTGVYTIGPEAFIAHVGDSRAYLWHGGILTRLTRDHSQAQDALNAGLPVASQSWHHALTNYLGRNGQQVWAEFHHFFLSDGDELFLCTDGLTNLVSDDEIAEVLIRGALPQEGAQALVDLALARGGRDNVTVILARYEMYGNSTGLGGKATRTS